MFTNLPFLVLPPALPPGFGLRKLRSGLTAISKDCATLDAVLDTLQNIEVSETLTTVYKRFSQCNTEMAFY